MSDRLTRYSINNPPSHTRVTLRNTSLEHQPSHQRKKDDRHMSSSHYRTHSPGGRRIVNPGRTSDPYHTQYLSPRASIATVPVSTTTTYVNVPRGRNSLEAYPPQSSRSSRTFYPEEARLSATYATHPHPHASSTVIRAPSPLPRASRNDVHRTHDTHLAPPSSDASRSETHMHKRIYSVDDGKSHLVADIAIQPPRTDKRHSETRGHNDRGHTSSHRTPHHHSERDEIVNLGTGYSYADPATLHREPETRRRHRAGSLETSRPRPTSMIADPHPSRSSRKDGPPISGGLAKYNTSLDPDKALGVVGLGVATGAGLSRGGSLRETVRSPNYPPYQQQSQPYQQQSHYPQERLNTSYDSRHAPASSYQSKAPDRRETHLSAPVRDPYEEKRKHESSRVYEDHGVSGRGSGVRSQARAGAEEPDHRDPHYERVIPSSSVSKEHKSRVHREEARKEQERRDHEYAREVARKEKDRDREDARREQERRDHEYAREVARKDKERIKDREYRESLEPVRREKPRERPREDVAYTSDRDRLLLPRETPRHRDHSWERHYDERYNEAKRSGVEGSAAALPAAVIGGLGAAAVAAIAKNREHDRRHDHNSSSDSDREDKPRRRHEREDPREMNRSPLSDHERRDERHNDRRRRHEREDPRETNRSPPSDHDARNERRDERRPREPRESKRNHSPPSDHDTRNERPDEPRPREPREAEKNRSAPETVPQEELDPEEDFRRRFQQAQKDLHDPQPETSHRRHNSSDSSPEPEPRRADREQPDQADRTRHHDIDIDEAPPPRALRHSPDPSNMPGTFPSIAERDPATRESRVRILDPLKDDEDQQPRKGILRKPTEKFPEDPHPIREGVAPLKDSKEYKDIPENARWTKISRKLVNPDCLREAKERFEERGDDVIVLRVVTVDEIQKLADRTAKIRNARYDEAGRAHKERGQRRRKDRDHDRRERDDERNRDEYSDESSDDEYESRAAQRLLEIPAAGDSAAPDFVRDVRDGKKHGDRGDRGDEAFERGDGAFMSGGL